MKKEPRFFTDIQDVSQKPKTGVKLPDDVYAQTMLALIIVCVDIVIVDRQQRVFYLGKRIVKPFQGWWWMGGRRMAFETARESASRIFTRETTIRIPEKRFEFLEMREYMLKNREQNPQESGTHGLVFQYAVELDSADELPQAMKYLDPNEYDMEIGLKKFDRNDIALKTEYPQPLLEVYDLIFPRDEILSLPGYK